MLWYVRLRRQHAYANYYACINALTRSYVQFGTHQRKCSNMRLPIKTGIRSALGIHYQQQTSEWLDRGNTKCRNHCPANAHAVSGSQRGTMCPWTYASCRPVCVRVRLFTRRPTWFCVTVHTARTCMRVCDFVCVRLHTSASVRLNFVRTSISTCASLCWPLQCWVSVLWATCAAACASL